MGRLSIRMERVRGFQPPWYRVQVVTCDPGHVTRWRASGARGFRRTPAGHLVAIHEVFPGRCATCDAQYAEQFQSQNLALAQYAREHRDRTA